MVASLARAGSPEAAETIQVRPDMACEVNHVDGIQKIFGGCVNGSTRDLGGEEIRALHLNSARAYLWGLMGLPERDGYVSYPRTPWLVAQYGGKSLSREESFAAWDRFYRQDFEALMEQWYQHGMPQNDQLYQLELFRKWDLTSGIVLHTSLDGSADRHPEAVNAFYKAYVDTLRRHAPWVKPDFIMFENEPDYSHWSGQFATTGESVDTFIRAFNRLETYFRENLQPIRLVGPSLSDAMFFSWAGWRNWTLPVLRDFNNVETFNYHVYGRGAGEHLAWLEMLQAAGESIRGVRPRAVITEANLTPNKSPEEDSYRWEAEHLFMALANPDKVALRTYFMLAYPDMPDTNSLLRKRDGKFAPSLVYWLYWTLADLRGSLRWVRPPGNRDLKVCASSPSDSELVVAVFNSGKEAREVVIDPGFEPSAGVESLTIRSVDTTDGRFEHGETVLAGGAAGKAFPLSAGGVASFHWKLSKPMAAVKGRMSEREYYGRDTAVSLNKKKDFVIETPAIPSGAIQPFLRIGLMTDDELAARRIEYALNGSRGRVSWDDQPTFLNESGKAANTWWVEVPLSPDTVKESNVLSFVNLDARYTLMFASIVYREFPSGKGRETWFANWTENQRKIIPLALRVSKRLMAGGSVPLGLGIKNNSAEAVTYKLTWRLPAGAAFADGPMTQEVSIPAGGEQKVARKVEVANVTQITSGDIEVEVAAEGRAKQSLSQNVTLYPRLEALRLASAPQMDGGISGWESIPEVRGRMEGLETSVRFAWDEKNLYALLQVRGDVRPTGADALSNYWMNDSVEIFVDLLNSKRRVYGVSDFQAFFCPVGPGGAPALGGLVPRSVRDDSIEVQPPRVEPSFQVVSRNLDGGGYSLECAMPWSALDPKFVARKGAELGFDVALNHDKAGGSILGAQGKAYAAPNQWGILTLR